MTTLISSSTAGPLDLTATIGVNVYFWDAGRPRSGAAHIECPLSFIEWEPGTKVLLVMQAGVEGLVPTSWDGPDPSAEGGIEITDPDWSTVAVFDLTTPKYEFIQFDYFVLDDADVELSSGSIALTIRFDAQQASYLIPISEPRDGITPPAEGYWSQPYPGAGEGEPAGEYLYQPGGPIVTVRPLYVDEVEHPTDMVVEWHNWEYEHPTDSELDYPLESFGMLLFDPRHPEVPVWDTRMHPGEGDNTFTFSMLTTGSPWTIDNPNTPFDIPDFTDDPVGQLPNQPKWKVDARIELPDIEWVGYAVMQHTWTRVVGGFEGFPDAIGTCTAYTYLVHHYDGPLEPPVTSSMFTIGLTIGAGARRGFVLS